MKYKLVRTKTFKRSFKKLNFDDNDLQNFFIDVIYKLSNGIKLEKKYKDHQLKGELKEFRECHLKPDLLLIYRIKDNQLELIDIGTHSELFK
jgi:mRNA interferase YafQ